MKKLILVCLLGFVASGSAAPLKLVLNWKPEAEFGGFYEADLGGEFKKQNLHVEILPGGVGVPAVQMVAAGQAEFGISSADEVIISQDRGTDVQALFAVYQTNPHALITREERGAKEMRDLFQGGILAVQQGLPYFLFLEKKFAPVKAKIVPYLGGVTQIAQDPKVAQQGFITSEPILAAKQGLKVKSFLVAESGFNPYTTVVIVKKAWAEKNADTVKRFFQAIDAGWKSYLKDPLRANTRMYQLNPTMDMETLAASAQVQKAIIETSDTKKHGLGSMNGPRWKTLASQLLDLKLIKKVKDPASYLYRPSVQGKGSP